MFYRGNPSLGSSRQRFSGVCQNRAKRWHRLNEMFRNGEVKKTYWAIVKECPKKRKANWFIIWSAMRNRISLMHTIKK